MDNQTGSAEAFFSKAGKKIDELFKELKESDFSEKLDLKNRLEELKKDKDRLSQQFDQFTKDNQDTFDDIRNSMEESIEDIKKAFSKRRKA